MSACPRCRAPRRPRAHYCATCGAAAASELTREMQRLGAPEVPRVDRKAWTWVAVGALVAAALTALLAVG